MATGVAAWTMHLAVSVRQKMMTRIWTWLSSGWGLYEEHPMNYFEAAIILTWLFVVARW